MQIALRAKRFELLLRALVVLPASSVLRILPELPTAHVSPVVGSIGGFKRLPCHLIPGRLTRRVATWHACGMTISLSASLLRLLVCGLVVALPVAVAQTPTTNAPAPPHKAQPAQTPPVQTPPTHKPPVVQPHGPTHALKPQPAKPAASKPAAAPPTPAPAEPPKSEVDTSKGSVTSLPTPRFVSLRSEEVNLRSGPGTRYPIEWVYKRRDLPVEIEREFEVWRLVRDMDGIRGWVHQATLTGRRSFVVKGAEASLRSEPKDAATAVAILQAGVIGRIRSCAAGSDWCDVQAANFRGYLRRDQLWGLLQGEAVTP
jgi:SH3-like domain-containing protein